MKFHPRTTREDSELEKSYGSTLSVTSALDGVGVQRHARAALPPRGRPGIYCTGAGWDAGPVWTGAENQTHKPEFDHGPSSQ
jgi:hypothetical protein